MKGTLEIIVGCMSCGKSVELMRLFDRAVYADQKVKAFHPSIDTRTDPGFITSRDGRRWPATPINAPSEVLEHVNGGCDVVGFDEVQFFPVEIIPVIDRLIDRGMRVIASGLDTDFRGEPFAVVAHLMAVADSVNKLNAICKRCKKPVATRSQRLIGGQPAPFDAPTIQVGGDEAYEARCRDCHVVPH